MKRLIFAGLSCGGRDLAKERKMKKRRKNMAFLQGIQWGIRLWERKIFFIVYCMSICMLISGCGSKGADARWQDGYYTARMAEYDFGWKEYVTICVMDNKIVSVEYNAKNASGFVKSWDNAYMRNMNPVSGTYPNRYTRNYAAEFLAEQSADNIDMIAGASASGKNFRKLAAAVLECAEKGDTEIAVVPAENAKE